MPSLALRSSARFFALSRCSDCSVARTLISNPIMYHDARGAMIAGVTMDIVIDNPDGKSRPAKSVMLTMANANEIKIEKTVIRITVQW